MRCLMKRIGTCVREVTHDRLFEMGFETQLTEILHKLPQSRQTLLFSATLPASLVEFAKAGLQDPLLIRLDVEQKISEDLETAFFTVKPAEKHAALLYILQEIIKIPTTANSAPSNSKKRKRGEGGITPHSTLIFVSTKHQVEFITSLLRTAHYSVSHVYGSLDQVARKENVEAFRAGESLLLVVTDVAARGIDIPILSNVINYDFPGEPKIFVHRVGRTARAGQRGWAYSLVALDDAPYFYELVAFLGRRVVMKGTKEVNYTQDLALGSIPRGDLERISEWVTRVVENNSDLNALRNVAAKGHKLYMKTRGTRSGEIMKKAKALVREDGWNLVHPLLGTPPSLRSNIAGERAEYDDARTKLLNSVSAFRPKETIFEIGHKGSKGKSLAADIMRSRRTKITIKADEPVPTTHDMSEDGSPETVALGKGAFRDTENYIAHFQPGNTVQERGYDVHRTENSFAEASKAVMMNLADDDGVTLAPARPKQRWDPKKKNFVRTVNDDDGSGGKVKMIRGESGVKIPATMKSGRFEEWQNAHKTKLGRSGMEEQGPSSRFGSSGRKFKHTKSQAPKAPDRFRDDYETQKKKATEAAKARKEGGELRDVNQIRKLRMLKEKRMKKNARPSKKKGKR
jgi:ATP-dependent RNA helicase DDX54/DBP10